jgi:hypothetical protein
MTHHPKFASFTIAQKQAYGVIVDGGVIDLRVCQGKVEPGFPEKTNENKKS